MADRYPIDISAEFDRLSALAADESASLDRLAEDGANAFYDAAQWQAPELIEPAAAMLDHVTAQELVAVTAPRAYFGARLALSFREPHRDWASGEYLRPESVATTHTKLAEFMGFASRARGDIGLSYLARSAIMGMLTRTGSTDCIAFPAPPSAQTDESMGNPNTLAAVNSALLAYDVMPRWDTSTQKRPGVINVYAGELLALGVSAFHSKYQEPRKRSSSKQEPYAQCLGFVAKLIVQEAASQDITDTDRAFLNRGSAFIIGHFKREAQRRLTEEG